MWCEVVLYYNHPRLTRSRLLQFKLPPKNIHATRVTASDSSRPISIEALTYDPPGPMGCGRFNHLCQLGNTRKCLILIEVNVGVMKLSCRRLVLMAAFGAFTCFWWNRKIRELLTYRTKLECNCWQQLICCCKVPRKCWCPCTTATCYNREPSSVQKWK